MPFQSQVSRLLDDEHRANLELLGQLEQSLARMPRDGGSGNADLAALLKRFDHQIAQDVGRHFDFEERELFPRLDESGDGDMAALLADEHAVIREVAGELLPLCRAAIGGTLDVDGWRALSRGTLELVERQVAHIQKETMALLPLLDDLLDDESDRQLALAYADA